MIKQTEILVIGGGPAGLSAACAAAELGASVLLCERDYLPGGQLVKQTHKFFGSEKQYAGERGIHIGNLLIEKAKHHPNIEILTEATVLGIYEDGIVTVFYHGKHMKIRPSKIILATGASEKFLEFPGNDLPGIYGAGAVQTLMNVAGVKPAERVLMVGAGNIGLIVSYQLMQAGVEVAVHYRSRPKNRRLSGPCLENPPRRCSYPDWLYDLEKAYGTDALEGVVIVQVDSQFQPVPGTEETIPCGIRSVWQSDWLR